MKQMPVNLAYQAYKTLWEALDWLFPPNCGGCNTTGTRWCSGCAQKTQEIPIPICPVCGNPNSNYQPCSRCEASRPLFAALRSYAVFGGPLREAIHKLKYKRNIGLGDALAVPMIRSLQKLNWQLDIITSVPLGLARFKERGYNQATLLAQPISLCLQIPFASRALSRIRETKTQVGLTVSERQENMAGVFRARKELVQGKKILVIDDVATSGATFNACAQALLEADASQVYGFSLARAIYSPGGDLISTINIS